MTLGESHVRRQAGQHTSSKGQTCHLQPVEIGWCRLPSVRCWPARAEICRQLTKRPLEKAPTWVCLKIGYIPNEIAIE